MHNKTEWGLWIPLLSAIAVFIFMLGQMWEGFYDYYLYTHSQTSDAATSTYYGGPVLTLLPLNWNQHTILYPYIYCHGGYDGPYLHDWGLRCTVELENETGEMVSSTEWLSPQAVSDALKATPNSTSTASNGSSSNAIDQHACGGKLCQSSWAILKSDVHFVGGDPSSSFLGFATSTLIMRQESTTYTFFKPATICDAHDNCFGINGSSSVKTWTCGLESIDNLSPTDRFSLPSSSSSFIWVERPSIYGWVTDLGVIWRGLNGGYRTPDGYFDPNDDHETVTTTASQTPQSLGYSDCTLIQ